jgi:hypothetical protein
MNVLRHIFLLIFAAGLFPGAQGSTVSPSTAFDHAIWHELLQTYVNASGGVDYAGLRAEKSRLETYLQKLQARPPADDWSRDEKLAYWINAYNAFTVKLILDNYPLKSIRDLNEPWDRKFIRIGGKAYSLNDIEHNIIRKEFDEPRIHFAVNCAAKSCPPLLNAAYTAAALDRQLEQQTRAFINNPQFNRLSPGQASLSAIFDWYKEDFTKGNTLIAYLNRYAKTRLQSDAGISYLEYDWGLNVQ